MNRLKNHTCYLVGSMDDGREEGKVWRDNVQQFLESLEVIVLNPYEKPLCKKTHYEAMEDDEGFVYRQRLKAEERYDELSQSMKRVRAVDLRLVDKADFIVAFLDFTKIMTGTLEEISQANRQRKPVIIISSLPKKNLPDWYFGQLPHELFFEEVETAKDYIQHIHEDETIDLVGHRWVFFDIPEKLEV